MRKPAKAMADNKQDISLRDFVLNVQEWRRFVLSRWIFIGVLSCIGALAGVIYAWVSRPTYTGDISFVLSSDSKEGGGLSSLAGQFGINLGGGGDDAFSGDNIPFLMTSRKMLRKALFKRPPDDSTLLINILIHDLKLDVKWKKKERLSSSVPFPDDPDSMTPLQDSLFREVYRIVNKKMLTVDKPDKKLGIMIAEMVSYDERVAVYVPRYLVTETAKFYIATKTQVAQQNLTMLYREADSIRHLLSGSIASTGEAVDMVYNLNPAYQVRRSSAQEGQINTTVLGTAYGEVVKDLEIAKITLQKETPLFQIIDQPESPLKMQKFGRLLGLLYGSAAGLLLGVFWVIVRRAYKIITN
jgi:hypothetical protein